MIVTYTENLAHRNGRVIYTGERETVELRGKKAVRIKGLVIEITAHCLTE